MNRTTPRRRIKELLRKPGHAFFATLAEDYDGIGQYIAVNLSKGSTAVAQKVRIAAGDFGGGRTFPAGTPVHVFARHGSLEVHLGNKPVLCTCLETFNRIEASGLGTGQFGTWLLDEDFLGSVNGTHTVINMEGNSYAYLPIPTMSLPFEMLTEFQLRAHPSFTGWSATGTTKAEFEYSMSLDSTYFGNPRSFANMIMSGLYPDTVLFPDGVDGRTPQSGPVGLDSIWRPLSWPPDDQFVGPLMMRFYVDDHGIYMRVWFKDQSEPKSQSAVAEIPYNPDRGFDPSIQAQWLAGGWGKGEAWSFFRARIEGFTNPLPASWDTFTAFGFGNLSDLEVDYICNVTGQMCQ